MRCSPSRSIFEIIIEWTQISNHMCMSRAILGWLVFSITTMKVAWRPKVCRDLWATTQGSRSKCSFEQGSKQSIVKAVFKESYSAYHSCLYIGATHVSKESGRPHAMLYSKLWFRVNQGRLKLGDATQTGDSDHYPESMQITTCKCWICTTPKFANIQYAPNTNVREPQSTSHSTAVKHEHVTSGTKTTVKDLTQVTTDVWGSEVNVSLAKGTCGHGEG